MDDVKFGARTIHERPEQPETHMTIHINWRLHILGGWSGNERQEKYADIQTRLHSEGQDHKSLENAKVIQMNLDANVRTT
jgi:hypothetical protein